MTTLENTLLNNTIFDNVELLLKLFVPPVSSFSILWLFMTFLTIITIFSEFFRAIIVYGKTRDSNAIENIPRSFLLTLEVKKKWWSYFYLIGMLFNMALLYIILFQEENEQFQLVLHWLQSQRVYTPLSYADLMTLVIYKSYWWETLDQLPIVSSLLQWIRPTTTVQITTLHVNYDTKLFLLLLTIQTTRRCIESFFITKFGDSRMHIGIFFIGIAFYLSLGMSVLSDSAAIYDDEIVTFNDHQWYYLLRYFGIFLFLYASYHQSICNYILAKQKSGKHNKLQYVIPKGDWFQYIRCPLYTAEILIYLSFVFVTGGTNVMMYFILLFVFVNQSVVAFYSSNWYDETFRKEHSQLPNYILCPFVW